MFIKKSWTNSFLQEFRETLEDTLEWFHPFQNLVKTSLLYVEKVMGSNKNSGPGSNATVEAEELDHEYDIGSNMIEHDRSAEYEWVLSRFLENITALQNMSELYNDFKRTWLLCRIRVSFIKIIKKMIALQNISDFN